MAPLDGLAVVITGSGRGLGREYALAVAAAGGRVVVNDVDGAEAVAAEVRARGGEAVVSTASVTGPGAGEELVRTAVEACAATFRRPGGHDRTRRPGLGRRRVRGAGGAGPLRGRPGAGDPRSRPLSPAGGSGVAVRAAAGS